MHCNPTLFSLHLLPSTLLLTHQWRAQGQVEKKSLLGLKLGEFSASLGELAVRPSGNPLCECGRKLAVLSPVPAAMLSETKAAGAG